MQCIHCQHEFPGGKFCPQCGKPTADTHTSVSVQKASDLMDGEFVFQLTSEELEAKLKGKAMLPFGCIAVTLADGRIQRIAAQRFTDAAKYSSRTPSTTAATSPVERVKQLAQGALAWLGFIQKDVSERIIKVKPDARTFVMLDVQDSPLLTHEIAVPVPGFMDGRLRFNFWVPAVDYDLSQEESGAYAQVTGDGSPAAVAKDLNLFFKRVVGNKDRVSVHQLRLMLEGEVARLVEQADKSRLGQADSTLPRDLAAALRTSLGIVAECVYQRGKNGIRHQFEVSRAVATAFCPKCGKGWNRAVNFCTCGHQMTIDWTARTSYLQSRSGEEITLLLNMLADDSAPGERKVDLETPKIAAEVIKYLGPVLRGLDTSALTRPEMLADLSRRLNEALLRDWRGFVTEFEVVDIRTAKEAWFFRTQARIDEAMRGIESEKQFLALGDDQLAVQAMAFDLALRKIRQDDDQELQQLRQRLDKQRQADELEIQKASMDAQVRMRKDSIARDEDRATADAEHEAALRARQAQRELERDDRSAQDEVLSHQMRQEKDTLRHDLDLSDMTLDAQSRKRRRDTDDSSYDKDAASRHRRQDADDSAYEIDRLGNVEENLKDRAFARDQEAKDREARRAAEEEQRELEHSRWVIAQSNQTELAKRQAMQGLDAAQMLAMQAAELAKAGGADGAASIVKAIADSQAQAAGAGIKDEMYKEMLRTQQQSSEALIAAQKEGAAAALGAYKDAAQIAQSTNEKSMTSMAQVATQAAAGSNSSYRDAAQMAQSVNEKSMASMAQVAASAAGQPGRPTPCAKAGCPGMLQPGDRCCTECGTPRA